MNQQIRKIDNQVADSKPADPEASAQEAFASYAAPLVSDAIEYANAVHEDASPEALHKLRVSLRRLRSLWWAFEPLLDKGENTRQRALYKFLATAAGNGSTDLQTGCAIYWYVANRSMHNRFFYDADGELLVVPQEGGFYGGWITSRVLGPFKGGFGTVGW